MGLNSSEKDSDHLTKLQEENGEEYEEAEEEVEDKYADQRKYAKETEKKEGWGNWERWKWQKRLERHRNEGFHRYGWRKSMFMGCIPYGLQQTGC